MKVGDLVRDTRAPLSHPRFSEMGIIVKAALNDRPRVMWSCGEITVEYKDSLEVINESR